MTSWLTSYSLQPYSEPPEPQSGLHCRGVGIPSSPKARSEDDRGGQQHQAGLAGQGRAGAELLLEKGSTGRAI